LEIESLLKGLEHASNLTDERFFDYYNNRLIAINAGKDPFILEQLGILKRPPLTPWIKIGSSYHPVLPSKDTPTA